VVVGLVLLIYATTSTWRAYRRASRRAAELSSYALEEAVALERVATSLNEHGFELDHTASELFPKLQRISVFLEQPLVGAALPWLLRRALFRPYRRR
jgi:type VI protein secretion system component VasK